MVRHPKGETMPEGNWIAYLELYGIYIVAISALIPFLVYAYKKGIKPVIMHIVNCYTMSQKIDQIFEEMIPNGGTSIKDKIDKIDTRLTLVGERLRAHFADVNEAHFETDTEGLCTRVNRTYTRMVERDPSEVLGHGWQNCVHPDDRERVTESWYDSVDEDRELSINFRFETPSGKVIPVSGTSYKMIDDEGDIIGYLGKLKIVEPIH